MREKVVEQHLVKCVESMGGLCEKFSAPGRIGVPDRICTLPTPVGMQLVEVKRPDGRVEPWQVRDHKLRAKLGIRVHVAYTIEEVDRLVSTWESAIRMRACYAEHD